MSDYDFSRLNPFKGRKKRVRQTQRVGKGSTSIQCGGDVTIDGEKVELEDYNNSRFTSSEILSIIGFVTLTACTTALEMSGGDGGGLWVLVVLWGMTLGKI